MSDTQKLMDELSQKLTRSKWWSSEFTAREMQEINFNCCYEQNFNHGTDAHNMRIIIAKLVHLLNKCEKPQL